MGINCSSDISNSLIIETTSLNVDDLKNFINLSAEIVQRPIQRTVQHPVQRRLSNSSDLSSLSTSSLVQAKMIEEKIFDKSNKGNNNLAIAPDHRSPRDMQEARTTNLDALRVAETMRYFEEQVPITYKKKSKTNKTTSAIASFKCIVTVNNSPPAAKRKSFKENVQEDFSTMMAEESPSKVSELKKYFECNQPQASAFEENFPQEPLQEGRLSFPNKVKEMARLLNMGVAEADRQSDGGYEPLSLPIMKFTQQTVSESTKATAEIPTIQSTTRVRTPSPFHPTPEPSSDKSNDQEILEEPVVQKPKFEPLNSCLIAEEVFRQLCVKDKVLLFNKFMSHMARRNSKFQKHAAAIKQKVAKKMLGHGEVVCEKQGSVKDLTKDLEAKCLSNSRHAGSIPKRCDSPIPCKPKEETDELHMNSLPIDLKPSPDTTRNSNSSIVQSRIRSLRLNILNDSTSSSLDGSCKSAYSLISAIKVPIEQHASPMKTDGTDQADRSNDSSFFEDEHLAMLFYNWVKEHHGILFDFTTLSDLGAIDDIISEASAIAPSGLTENEYFELILEKVIAKLDESKEEEISCNEEELPYMNEPEKVSVNGIDEIPSPSRDVLPSNAEDTSNHKIEQEIKHQSPPMPILMPESAPIEGLSSSSCASSASSLSKLSNAQNESGLSVLPKPPENELQKSHDHNPAALSEHQLRVQASLQRLNIPDWFRQYNQNSARSPDGHAGAPGTTTSTTTHTTIGGGYKPGNFTRKRTQDSGRWAGLNSKTTSLSSLGSHRSDRSPLLLSPSAHSHHGGQSAAGSSGTHHYSVAVGSTAAGNASGGGGGGAGGAGAFSRWSTSHLNSTQTSPSVSQRGSFARGVPINSSFMSVASGNSGVLRNSYRQPYLGWRSQEKLSQRTPHERLASSLLQQRTSPTQRPTNGLQTNLQAGVTPEIQSSIKEVTSAIVHYVNDQNDLQQQQQQRSRSVSPNSRKCWLESSFVGIRPLDSPQTPVIENNQSGFSNSNSSFGTGGAQTTNNYNHTFNTATQQLLTTSGQINLNPGTTDVTTLLQQQQQQQQQPLRMNGLSRVGGGGAPERSLSNASLEDVLASLLGLPTSSNIANTAGSGPGTGPDLSSGSGSGPGKPVTAARSTTGDSASLQQQQQQQLKPNEHQVNYRQQLEVQTLAEQQRLRRRSEGDAPSKKQQNQQQQQQQQHVTTTVTTSSTASENYGATDITTSTNAAIAQQQQQQSNSLGAAAPRRVSLGDSSESQNKTTSELQIKCRNSGKCENSATPADAKKFYKSCHNCTHLYCSRECRRAHWEKHRKACLHSRASNLCRQVLATCKDDNDTQRHLSLLARKGFLSQGRGVVRVLFRSAEAAEGFIKNGFQCMGEASYVRWPDLMPAEMGLELYSELLKLSTEYKPDSKMLIYVAICVVSEAPGMGQAPVRWERQLVSRCAKLKLCKNILIELQQQQQALQQPMAVVAVPQSTDILILTFNPALRTSSTNRELILSNILDILSRRGVLLRKHYPEIYQRLQTYTEGQTEKFNPVTLHPRDSQTGQSFVCIIMPVHSDSEIIKLPSAADGGNRVTTIDVGSPAALAQLDDDELLTRTTTAS